MPKQLIALIAIVLYQAALGTAYLWGLFAQPTASGLGVSVQVVTTTFSLFAIFYTVGVSAGGQLYRRLGPALLLFGAIFCSIGYWLCASSASIWPLRLGFGMMTGLGVGLGYLAALTKARELIPSHAGFVGGISLAGFGAGSFLFSPVILPLIASNWRVAFHALSLVTVATGVLAFATLPASLKKIQQPADEVAANKSYSPNEFFRSAQLRRVWVMFIVATSMGLFYVAHMRTFLLGLGVTQEMASLGPALFGLGSGTGRIGWGWLADKYGAKTSQRLAAVFIAITPAVFYLAQQADPMTTLGTTVLAGIGFGGCLATLPPRVSVTVGPQRLAAAFGIAFTGYGIGGTLGPLLGSWSLTSLSSFLPTLVGFSLLTLSAVVYDIKSDGA